jgi:hypothetical protein
MFHAFNFPWPASVLMLFEVASMSTASIDIAAPQCTINLTYTEKWIASQALPVFLMVVTLLGVVVAMVVRASRSIAVAWRRQVRNALTRGTKTSRCKIIEQGWKNFTSGLAMSSDFVVGTMFTVRVYACACACV